VDTHSRVLGHYPERAVTYGSDVRERLDRSSAFGLSDYLAASCERQRLVALLVSAVSSVDVLLTPVATVAPPTVDRPDVAKLGNDEIDLRAAIMGFTVPQNLAGLPTVTFPAAKTADGLPCGLQVSSVPGGERIALSVAGLLSRQLQDLESLILG
jgi:Asp-tRNA(Asn)/Glu-tRNA(Gln) amidotransferase A subunit family amidase